VSSGVNDNFAWRSAGSYVTCHALLTCGAMNMLVSQDKKRKKVQPSDLARSKIIWRPRCQESHVHLKAHVMS
jgi:hypothetical protein